MKTKFINLDNRVYIQKGIFSKQTEVMLLSIEEYVIWKNKSGM